MQNFWTTKYINIFLIILSNFIISHAKENEPIFRQEAAKITYVNDKYFKDVKVFTYRPSRSSPYLTSINATNLFWWGNNCTFVLEYTNLRSQSETYALDFKVCDALKFPWLQSFTDKYSDVKVCPVPPGTYHFNGFELPPRNFPFPVSQGDYHVKLILRVTKTKERMIVLELDLKFQKKNKG